MSSLYYLGTNDIYMDIQPKLVGQFEDGSWSFFESVNVWKSSLSPQTDPQVPLISKGKRI